MPITFWLPLIIGLICLLFPGFFVSKRKGEVQQRKNIRRIRNCGWLAIIAAGLFFLSSMLSGQGFRGMPDLEVVAAKINKNFPKMIDKDIRADGLTAGDNQLIFQYTLVNHQAVDIDQVLFAQTMEKEVKASIYNDKFARRFLEKGISLRYDYYSSDDYLLASIDIPPISQDD